MSVRILIVDDHEGWSRYVALQLQNDLRYHVVGVAADGPEALRAAEELEPDLVVLDIGLPTLNGFDVARGLGRAAPNARILFLTEHRSKEMAEAALRVGACGYVVKSDAGRELLPAVTAIAEGRPFVSARLHAELAPDTPLPQPWRGIRHHDLLLATDDTALVEGYAGFAADALRTGASVILIAAPPCRAAVRDLVQAHKVDVDAAIASGRYVPLDVTATLATFMVDGWPEVGRFTSTATSLLAAAGAAARHPHPRVVACGECAPALWQQGNADAAIRLEQLWDELSITSGVDILCGYAGEGSGHSGDDTFVRVLHALHSHVESR